MRATPFAIGTAALVVGIQTFRVVAISVAGDALTGGSGAAWFFPSLADFCFGVTAPFVAYALWRWRNPSMWMVGIVWLSLALFDFVDGLVTSIAIGPPPGAASDLGDVVVFSIVWICLNALAIVLLIREVRKS